MGLTYNQIVYFITVADCMNISEAAKQLFMTQPALGRQITALERELNMQLLIRTTHGLALTPAGRYLQEKWSGIRKHLDQSIEQAQKISAGYQGSISLGILEEADATTILGNRIAEFEMMYPGIELHLYRYSFKELRRKLLNRELDMIISYEMDLQDVEGLSWERVCPQRPAWAIPKRSRLYEKSEITFADFKDEEIIVTSEKDTPFGEKIIIEDCRRYGGFYPKLYLTDTVNETMLALEMGTRCAIINMEMNIASTDKVRMVPLSDLEPNLGGDLFFLLAWKTDSDNGCIPLCKSVLVP